MEKFQPGVQNISPQTISASNNLHRVCLRFQLTNLEYKMFPPKQHMQQNLRLICIQIFPNRFCYICCFPKQILLHMLFSIGNEKAFLNATQSSSIWSRPDLEMQFQTRSIVPNYFERSLPALTRCQYLLLFLLTLKQKLELKLWTARRRGIWR